MLFSAVFRLVKFNKIHGIFLVTLSLKKAEKLSNSQGWKNLKLLVKKKVYVNIFRTMSLRAC